MCNECCPVIQHPSQQSDQKSNNRSHPTNIKACPTRGPISSHPRTNTNHPNLIHIPRNPRIDDFRHRARRMPLDIQKLHQPPQHIQHNLIRKPMPDLLRARYPMRADRHETIHALHHGRGVRVVGRLQGPVAVGFEPGAHVGAGGGDGGVDEGGFDGDGGAVVHVEDGGGAGDGEAVDLVIG